MRLLQHKLCTRKKEGALEVKFYLDIHRVYIARGTNADQRKWRWIRISTLSIWQLSAHCKLWNVPSISKKKILTFMASSRLFMHFNCEHDLKQYSTFKMYRPTSDLGVKAEQSQCSSWHSQGYFPGQWAHKVQFTAFEWVSEREPFFFVNHCKIGTTLTKILRACISKGSS